MSCLHTFNFLKTLIAISALCFLFSISRSISVNSVNTFEKNDDDPEDYEKTLTWKDVSRIFKKECVVCHSTKNKTANLDLSSYQAVMRGGKSGTIIVPKDPKASLVMKYIKGDKKPRMPMGGKPLKESEIKLIERWIATGAQEK